MKILVETTILIVENALKISYILSAIWDLLNDKNRSFIRCLVFIENPE